MSQFLIAVCKEKPESVVDYLKFVPVEEAQPVFMAVTDHYGVEPEQAWAVLDRSGDTTDELFSDAALELSQADKLSQTDLGVLLGELFGKQCQVIAWYATDYEDLENISSAVEIVVLINTNLPISSGEIYFYYS